jgi:spore cortex formation protein SpoVR/YcgB (stage V sporulation)
VAADGMPLSYRHYVYGMRRLVKAQLRESFARVSDLRIAHHAQDRDYREWRRRISWEMK